MVFITLLARIWAVPIVRIVFAALAPAALLWVARNARRAYTRILSSRRAKRRLLAQAHFERQTREMRYVRLSLEPIEFEDVLKNVFEREPVTVASA